jgi:hypothetical protein
VVRSALPCGTAIRFIPPSQLSFSQLSFSQLSFWQLSFWQLSFSQLLFSQLALLLAARSPSRSFFSSPLEASKAQGAL